MRRSRSGTRRSSAPAGARRAAWTCPAADAQDVFLPPGVALTLAMGVHELATNAVRHGALSMADGRVRVACLALGGDGGEAPRNAVEWVERGGPPIAGPPARRGFGLRLLERGLAMQSGMGAEPALRARGPALHPPPAPASQCPPEFTGRTTPDHQHRHGLDTRSLSLPQSVSRALAWAISKPGSDEGTWCPTRCGAHEGRACDCASAHANGKQADPALRLRAPRHRAGRWPKPCALAPTAAPVIRRSARPAAGQHPAPRCCPRPRLGNTASCGDLVFVLVPLPRQSSSQINLAVASARRLLLDPRQRRSARRFRRSSIRLPRDGESRPTVHPGGGEVFFGPAHCSNCQTPSATRCSAASSGGSS